MRIVVSAVALLVVSIPLAGCPGKECSDSEPCANGLQCSADGLCVASDGGGDPCTDSSHPEAPNLIHDPGFECGVSDWAPYLGSSVAQISQDTTNPRTGKGALRLQYLENPKQTTIAAFGPVLSVTPGETICMRAFMRGTAANGHLVVREAQSGGGVINNSYSSPITVNEWTEVPPSVNLRKIVVSPTTTSVHMRFELRQMANQDTLFVDDAALWKSPDGSCSER